MPGLTVHLDAATVQLLHWHACRQRLDRRRAGPAWQQSLRVFTDETGRAYTEANADEAVTIAAARGGAADHVRRAARPRLAAVSHRQR